MPFTKGSFRRGDGRQVEGAAAETDAIARGIAEREAIVTTITTLKTIACTVALFSSIPFTTAQAQTGVSPAEVRAIAKEAYIYGFPMVDGYRSQYGYFVDRKDPESDTPDSFVGVDLRAEPVVLTVPPIARERYFSIQLIDAYSFNFAYIAGNDDGNVLIAGPNWKGEVPKGVKNAIRSETELVLAVYRTQLFNPGDLDNVKNVQAGYKAQTLSAFLGQPAPKAAPAIDFIKPLTRKAEETSLRFFNI